MEKLRIRSIIESILFVSDKPVAPERLFGLFDGDVEAGLISECLDDIRKDLEMDEGRGFILENVADGWQLRTKAENQNWLVKLENIKPVRFSQAVLEVLAIIAYKQPITKSEIDKIRGIDSSHLLRTLLERNMIKITGRSDLPGKPLIYGTTYDFLEIFGINDLKELPSYAEIEELVAKSLGNSGDIKEPQLNLKLKSVVQEQALTSLNESEISEEALTELDELKKELKIDLDLVQEQVDVIFEEACRKYVVQREQIRNNRETDNAKGQESAAEI